MGYAVLTYGTYSHAAGEVKLDSIERRHEFDERGGVDKRIETWTFSGLLVGTSQSDLTTKMSEMQTAYAKHNVDVVFKPDGSTTGAHSMTAAAALQGPRCSSFSWGSQTESEYSVHRSFSVTVEGVFEFEANTNDVTNFNESVTIQGGGARRQLVEFISGYPQEFQLCEYTIVTATQTGSATGRDTYPDIPDPLWPANEDLTKRSITKNSPSRNENDSEKYFTVSWSYGFDFIEWPENGEPHSWA
jgi:hypothetical protein